MSATSSSPRSLPRELTVTIGLRAVTLCAGLTALVFLMQLVRALDRLPAHLALDLALLGQLAGYTTPALLTLTLPMSLLVATGLTVGERVADGEVAGWAALGRSRLRLVRGVIGLAVVTSLVCAGLSGWLAPRALERAAVVLEDTTAQAITTTLTPARAVRLEGGIWVAGRPVLSDHDATRVAIDDLLAVDPHAQRSLRARRATWQPHGAHPGLRLDGVEAVSYGEPCTRIAAAALEVPIATATATSMTDSVVPALERRDVGALWAAARTGDTRSGGQLVKRAVLIALSPMLLLVLMAASTRWPPLGRPDLGMVAALGLAATLHAVARGCELVARVDLTAGATLAAALCVASGATGALALRRT